MQNIFYILFAASGILICALFAYGYRRAVRRNIAPDVRPARVALIETVNISIRYINSHTRLIIIHTAEYISHLVHAGTQAVHKGSRSIIRSSFFPHKEVDNHESLLQALIEEKKAIREDIDKLKEG